MKSKILFIVSQAEGTKENQKFLTSALKFHIPAAILSLDDLNLQYTNMNQAIRINLRRQKVNIEFSELMDKSDGIIERNQFNSVNRNTSSKILPDYRFTFTKKTKQNYEIIFIIRRLSDIKNGKNVTDPVVFNHRLNKLRYLKEYGDIVINPPEIIELLMDKILFLSKLDAIDFEIIKRINYAVVGNYNQFINFYSNHNSDVIVKPIFGGRGAGISRIKSGNNEEKINSIKEKINYHQPIMIQEFIPNGTSDIRFLIYKQKIIAAMERTQNNPEKWIFNIHEGAIPKKLEIPAEDLVKVKEDIIKIVKDLDCQLCGIDILKTSSGYYLLEGNSIPGLITIQDYCFDQSESLFDQIIRNL